jgi:predicted NodU family carbamoyl transferase
MKIFAYKPGHDGHVALLEDGRLAFSIEAEKDSGPRYGPITPELMLRGLSLADDVPDVLAVSGWLRSFRPMADPIGAGYFGETEAGIIDRPHRFQGRDVRYFSSSHERSHIVGSYAMSPFPQGQPCYALVWEGVIGSFYRIDEKLGVRRLGTPMSGPGHKYGFLYGLADPKLPVDARKSRREDAGKLMAIAGFARREMTEGLPLLVSGGCGLNCDWNSAWIGSGLFADVFVQPCTNDSGSAIGTAADAQYRYTGNAKIAWDAYAGEDFVHDEADLSGFEAVARDDGELAARLKAGAVFAWVQGRYEIGPRALGNRSLIAAPFSAETHTRLNAIKQREGFRPIAPILLEEELDRHFGHHGPSPHMLFFQTVTTDALKAVTHVDGSARAQTVTQAQNPQVHALLTAFKAATGYGVLCNTSLNFSGKGFINRMSDLVRYARDTGLDGFVVGEVFYRKA